MIEYKVETINDLCIKITDGSHFSPEHEETGEYQMYSVKDMDYNGFLNSDCKMIGKEMFLKLAKSDCRPLKNDILIAKDGSYLKCAFKVKEDLNACILSSIAILRPNIKNIDPDYFVYLMRSKTIKSAMANYVSGSALPRIILSDFKKMKLKMISNVEIQTKISTILSRYDEAIENNNKRIKLLEQMAQNLYKEWFVRFRFPGWENCEFENGIPKAWNYVKFEDILSFERGISYSSEEIECDDGLNLINLKNIDSFGGFRRDGTKKYNGKYKENQVVIKGDLVVGVTDMTQDRRTVGAVALIPTLQGLSVISADLVKVISDISNVYLYSLCRYGFYSKYFSQFANGANVLHLKPSALLNKKVLLPSKELIDSYVKKASVMIDLIDELNLANENLAKQRDLLLPRLMSGKLEVR